MINTLSKINLSKIGWEGMKTGKTHKHTNRHKLTCRSSAKFVSAGQKDWKYTVTNK